MTPILIIACLISNVVGVLIGVALEGKSREALRQIAPGAINDFVKLSDRIRELEQELARIQEEKAEGY